MLMTRLLDHVILHGHSKTRRGLDSPPQHHNMQHATHVPPHAFWLNYLASARQSFLSDVFETRNPLSLSDSVMVRTDILHKYGKVAGG